MDRDQLWADIKVVEVCNPMPQCQGCMKYADEIDYIVDFAEMEDIEPEEWVKGEEGTYNRINGHFLCDRCYIEAGQPSSSNGWICP